MPSTINGIGTRYYGQKNVQLRPAACPHCGRGVELKSYDTRLWFVVFFIPIVPLGHKRIVDQCPSCTRHYSVDAEKWETSKQLDVSGALDKYRASPTPEAAMETHQALLSYHEFEQATVFAHNMRQTFPANAAVHAYLGAALTHYGKDEEAAADYKRALELRPDLPEARTGVAVEHMRHGRLDEARKLLDFLEQPGAAQLYPLSPLEDLAYAFQKANRHTEALELFGKLIAAFPQLAQNRHFRKKIQQSEKATRSATILPTKKFRLADWFQRQPTPNGAPAFSRSGLIVIGGIIVLVLVGSLVANVYTKHHRTLFVVSGFKEPAKVEIRGQPPVTVRSGPVEVTLPEGRHHATITGPVRQEIDFEIRSDFFGRWFGHPAWVLNVGGSAILVLDETVYSKNPRPGGSQFYYRQPFISFGKVSHPFRDLPQTIRMKSHEERVLTHLGVLPAETESFNVFYHYLEQRQTNEALRLAEWRLRLAPDDASLLRGYIQTAAAIDLVRLQKFLRAGITNRPVAIEWHRMFQSLSGEPRRGESMTALYDSMLAAEPGNSALIYLRGRLCTNQHESTQWFERARQADQRNPYPYFALAYNHTCHGEFPAARSLLAKAVELSPESADFNEMFFRVRMALGEFTQLENELRTTLRRKPGDIKAALDLMTVLSAQSKRSEAESAVLLYAKNLPAPSRQFLTDLLRYHMWYVFGDFATMAKATERDRTPAGRMALFSASIEQGRVAEATRIFPLNAPNIYDPYHFLAVSLAWRLAGDIELARAWREEAIQRLKKGEPEEARAAALLQQAAPPTNADLEDLALPPKSQAILLAVLATLHPNHAAALNASARKMNVDRDYPYHLVQRATARTN
jgi:tetratricopeptide (TPR) repeat protein